MARPQFPWVYPYTEDVAGTKTRYKGESERSVLRPTIIATASAAETLEQKVEALIDSGSEHTLCAPWIARALGLDLGDAFRELPLGIGGNTLTARFLDVSLRIYAPQPNGNEFFEWQTEVGFVDEWRPPWQILLGQVGFLDRFTVTMHRGAQAFAVHEYERFDEEYGVLVRLASEVNPRFEP